MGLRDRFFKRRRDNPPDRSATREQGRSVDDLIAKLERDTMGFDEFRAAILQLIWREDRAGLARLCEDQVVLAPIFISKAIEEIRPGNPWNDVLWLMGQRLIEAGRLPHLAPLLEEKRHLVPNPEGGKQVMAPFVVVTKEPIDESSRVPVSLLRLLHGDMTGIDPDDDNTIDRMFADWLVIGPGFYHKYLAETDFSYGDRIIFRIPMGTPPQVKTFEGRVLRGKARLIPLVLEQFESILAQYRKGHVRQATQEERDLFYSQIDFEIAERPVHVVEAGEGQLLIYLQEGDRIHWIESLEVWHGEDRSKPLGSLDGTVLDALRRDFK